VYRPLKVPSPVTREALNLRGLTHPLDRFDFSVRDLAPCLPLSRDRFRELVPVLESLGTNGYVSGPPVCVIHREHDVRVALAPITPVHSVRPFRPSFGYRFPPGGFVGALPFPFAISISPYNSGGPVSVTVLPPSR
jgi:hypothetical protein